MNYGYVFILLATLFFSSMEVALKTVAYDFHPMQLNCTRFLIGGLLLLPFGLKSLKKKGIAQTTPPVDMAPTGFTVPMQPPQMGQVWPLVTRTVSPDLGR